MKIDSKLLEKAIIFATDKHKGMVRKGNGMPYILHPLSVLIILNEVKKSKNQFLLAIACIFHDLIEDTDVTLEDIAKEFGYGVASLVSELTSDKDKIKEMGKAPYLLDKMLNMSSYALCIKLADRLHNISDMSTMSDEFKHKYSIETNFILDGLVNRKLTKTHMKLISKIKKQLK